jgi:hypothetical protein
MSDQHDAGSLPELTPEQESDVRRLLAEARHDGPIPTDVADRLDTVLAGLTRDEPGSPGVAPVIDLAARRRRRNAAAVLAGAAAVIVAGFGIGQVIDVSSGDADDSGTSAGAGADRAGPANEDQSRDEGGAMLDGAQESAPQATAGQVPLTLSSKNLRDDVTNQVMAYSTTASGAVGAPPNAFAAIGCQPPAAQSKFGLGDFFPALFDGQPAVLALRPPADGKQRADVLACETAASLASVTIPSR